MDVKETHIWGLPGCGKTTYVSRQIANAVEKYGAHALLVTSFTRAAATELVMRDLPVERRSVGTLHSHCYRALDHPVIAEAEVKAWNRDHPEFRLTASAPDLEEPEVEFTIQTHGDELYTKLQILRARMMPQEQWPAVVRRFAAAWEQWKRSTAVLDYTDLLEMALREFRIAPGNPKVIFVDEAQDLSRLQLALVRQRSKHAEHLVMAADDDQAVLTFCGADPDALLESDGPEYFRKVLSQSYRLPRTIRPLSETWIQGLSRRQPKQYRPRDAEGEVRLLPWGTNRNPGAIVDDAENYLARGKTVMFLATCSYILEALKRTLRQRGLYCFNPYRKKRLDWNPLAAAKSGSTPAERLHSFLKPRLESALRPWVGADLRRWVPWLHTEGMLREGAMDAINALTSNGEVTLSMLMDLFERDSLEELVIAISEKPLAECVRWWLDHLVAAKRKRADYPARVAVRSGVNALVETPRIIIGTGHSVKGGEADVVYVFPDLSASGMRQWEGSRKDRDAVIRLGYVMITRARESLIICEAATARQMPLASFAVKAMRESTGNDK